MKSSVIYVGGTVLVIEFNEEIQQIKTQFTEVIRWSQNIPEPRVDKLFEKWFYAKENIIRRIFGNQLMLNLGRVSYDISTETKRNKINVFYNWVSQFYPTTKALEDFLSTLTPEEFYDNHLANNYIFDDKKINKGTKVIKAFKHFINDEELLEAIQNKASELIQENKISGELILSVHPLDFLSSSENTSKWRSCHALDGEYRAGNLSYMQDQTTIMAYLRGEGGETHKLPNFPESVPWNNKKWRCLFFINDQEDSNLIFAGRPYPMAVDGILESVRSALIARLHTPYLWAKPNWTEWSNETITAVTVGENTDHNRVDGYYYYIGTEIFRNNNLIKDAKHSTHYNDLLHSSCYQPLFCYDKTSYFGPGTKLRIGAECFCLWCGEEHISTHDTMMCKYCECEYGAEDNDDYIHCEYCGARHYHGDMHDIDGTWICPTCYERHTFTCACCGSRFPNHEQRYSENLKEFVCEYCHRQEEEKLEREQKNRKTMVFRPDDVRIHDAHITVYNDDGSTTEMPVTINNGGLQYTTIDDPPEIYEPIRVRARDDWRVEMEYFTSQLPTLFREIERNESSDGQGSISEGSSSAEVAGIVGF